MEWSGWFFWVRPAESNNSANSAWLSKLELSLAKLLQTKSQVITHVLLPGFQFMISGNIKNANWIPKYTKQWKEHPGQTLPLKALITDNDTLW